MATGSPFSGSSLYETGPLLSSANPGAGGGVREAWGEGRGGGRAGFDCK